MPRLRAFVGILFLASLASAGRASSEVSSASPPGVSGSGMRYEGIDGPVHAITEWNGFLIVGGDFAQAGNVPALNIARWDGTSWSALGPGLQGPVTAFAVYNGDLIAGTAAGGGPPPHVARWDGSVWHTLGGGLDGEVYALSVFQGSLIAGGDFQNSGATSVKRVARWDGSTWSPLGTGVNGEVDALVEFSGSLVVGGRFSSAGGVAASRIARWDGTSWFALGAGLNGDVLALTSYAGGLIAGGEFLRSDQLTLNRIGRWDGSAWSPLGSGTTSKVLALAVHDTELVAGGEFNTAGGVTASYVAQWDGEAWEPLASGTSGHVLSMKPWGLNLIVGGEFDEAGGGAANRIAVWDGASWWPLAPIGACCLPIGTCTILTLEACGTMAGSFLGNATTCDPDPCAALTGACCLPDGSCQMAVHRDCVVLCGWSMGSLVDCDPNQCGVLEGACCQENGLCGVHTALQCAESGREFLGANTTCTPNPCQPYSSTDVNLWLLDQDSTPIPNSQFCVGGIYVPQGGRISLAAGTRYVTLYPGINGQSQTSLLSRFDSLAVTGNPVQTVNFVWRVADLAADLVDQEGSRIPASRWRAGGLPVLPAGASIRLPVTEDPATPDLAGNYANGYGLSLYPGLNYVAQTDLLARVEDGELHPGDGPLVRTWWCAAGPLNVVDSEETEIEGSRFLFGNDLGGGFTGDPVVLPVTDDPSAPSPIGLLAGGYQIGVQPSVAQPMQYFPFELDESLSLTPAFVEISGTRAGLRLNLPTTGGVTRVVKVDGSGDFPTIAGALAASSPGDTVRVMAGTYFWPVQTGNPIDFAGKDVVVVSQGGPSATVLDFSGGAGQIRFSGGESYRAVLEGFTLRNGQYDGDNGALRISGASPTIRNCVICGSKSNTRAAVCVLAGSAPRLQQCTITGNSCAQKAGGLYVAAGTSTRMEHCVLWGNCKSGTEYNYRSDGGTIWFHTCVLNTSGSSGPIVLEYGNIFTDPQFCAPVSCSEAPTAGGVYSVRQGSPCLLPDGFRLIGALDEGCGAQSVWDGQGDAVHWSDARNWVGDALPGADSYVEVTLAGSYTVLLDMDAQVRHLELGSAVGTQGLRLQGSELTLERGGVNRGDLTVASGSRLQLAGTGDPSVFFLNEGELVLEGGEVSGNSRVENQGTIRKITGADGSLTPALNNRTGAAVVVEAGALHLTGLLEHRGSLILGADATLDLGSGPDPAVCDSTSSLTLQGGAVLGTRNLDVSGVVQCSASFPSKNVLSVPVFLRRSAQLLALGGELELTRQMECEDSLDLRSGALLRLSFGVPGERLQIQGYGELVLTEAQMVGPGEIANLGRVTVSGPTSSQVATKLSNLSQLSPEFVGHVDLALGGLTVERLENFGLVSIDSSAVLTVGDTLQNRSSGIVEGSGTLDVLSAMFQDEGRLRPGGDGRTGILKVEGLIEQGPQAIIDVEIAGKVAGTEFDQILCRGGHFNGSLYPRNIRGYVPQLGDSFAVLVAQGASLLKPPRVRIDGPSCVSGLELAPGLYVDWSRGDSQRILGVVVSDPENDQRPVLSDDSASTDWLTPCELAVLNNDADPDGDPLRVVRLERPGTLGQTTILPGDSLIFYNPPVSFAGVDSFLYIATDCRGLNDTAWVAVDVSCPPEITLRVPSQYATIQSALDTAVSSDTILVGPGVYEGTGNVGLDFRGKALVVLSEAGAEFTTLDCDSTGPGVVFHSGETEASVLQGLTIRNAGQPGASGGAVRIEGASPSLVDCVLHGNFAERGGAVSVAGGSVRLLGCTVADNRASDVGGALYGDSASVISLERSIVWDNCAPGGGDDFWTGGDVTFNCCVVDSALDHAALVSYEGDNFFSSPMFCMEVDCGSSPQSAGSYHVDLSSWCVGNNNPCGQRIGAQGFECAINSGLEVNGSGIPAELTLHSPVPNPASGLIQIGLGLPRSGVVRLCLYDVSGRLVREVLNRELPAGFFSLTGDLKGKSGEAGLSSGVYFVQMRWGRETRVTPLIIIR